MKRQTAILLILVLAAIFPAPFVHAQDNPPPVPHAFYGSVEVDGQPASVGTVIEARGANVLTSDENNPITVTAAGKYGGPTRSEAKLVVQGALQDDQPIEFYVNGLRAQVQKAGEEIWQVSYPYIQGVVTHLNLKVGSGQQQVESSPTPTATQSPLAQATSTATQAPTGQTSVTEPTAVQVATATRQAGQSTAVANTAVSTATSAQPTVVESPVPQATPLPGAVVTNPTQVASDATTGPSSAPATQPVQVTASPVALEAPTGEPTGVLPTATATAAKVAAVPNATAQPILSQAKPPEAVQSVLSETANDGSARTIAFWAGLVLVLVAVAIGVFVKVRGVPR